MPVDKLPREILACVYSFLSNNRERWAFLLTQRWWLECVVDQVWMRPQISDAESLDLIVRTLLHCSQMPATGLMCDYSALIRRLNLQAVAEHVLDAHIEAFHNCENLERVVLTNAHRLSDSAVTKLLSKCSRLQSIDISMTNLGDQVPAALSQYCPLLQGVYAAKTKISTRGLVSLIGNRYLKRIKLAHCTLSDAGLLPLIVSCSQLIELDLSFISGGVSVAVVCAALLSLPQLRELRLSGSPNLTDEAFESLKSVGAPHLRVIDLGVCPQLTDAVVEALVAVAPKLHHVTLTKCPLITDRSLVALARLTTGLHYLHVGHCSSITDRGVAEVAANCLRLQYVDVANCLRLTNQSVRCLAALPRLRRIGLVKCLQLDDSGILALAERDPRESVLERVHLSYCHAVTASAILRLLNACPRLTHLSLTGVQAFMHPDFVQFCRVPPSGLSQHQQAVFCIYSGEGVDLLRMHLNHRAASSV